MNFDYDPERHPPEVGRVMDRMTHLLESGKRPKWDVVGALCEGIEFVAKADGVDYRVVEAIVFGAIDRDAGMAGKSN